jgi:hypothetical protein
VLIALVTLLIFAVLGDSPSFEQQFYNRMRSKAEFGLRDLAPSDEYCVLPGGEFPRLFVRAKYDGYTYYEARAGDSQDDWFVLLISRQDQTVKVMPIDYREANLRNTVPICSARLRVYVSSSRSVFVAEQ